MLGMQLQPRLSHGGAKVLGGWLRHGDDLQRTPFTGRVSLTQQQVFKPGAK